MLPLIHLKLKESLFEATHNCIHLGIYPGIYYAWALDGTGKHTSNKRLVLQAPTEVTPAKMVYSLNCSKKSHMKVQTRHLNGEYFGLQCDIY